MAYAQMNAVVILDFQLLSETRQFSLRTTRDFQANEDIFPLRELRLTDDVSSWTILDKSKNVDVTVVDGRKICKICGLLVSELEISCEVCVQLRDTGRGRHPRNMIAGDNCARSRCKGHKATAETPCEMCMEPDTDNNVPKDKRRRRIRKKTSKADQLRAEIEEIEARLREVQKQACDAGVDLDEAEPEEGADESGNAAVHEDSGANDVQMDDTTEEDTLDPVEANASPEPAVFNPLQVGVGNLHAGIAQIAKEVSIPDEDVSEEMIAKVLASVVPKTTMDVPDSRRAGEQSDVPKLRHDLYNNMRSMLSQEAMLDDISHGHANLSALLMRVIPMKDPLARSESALSAIATELGKVTSYGALDFKKVREWSEVKSEASDLSLIHLMWSHIILGIKSSERAEQYWRWKARLVGDGHRILDGHGVHVRPRKAHIAPASLISIRCCVFFSLTQPGGVVYSGDAENAFLRSVLPGPAVVWVALEDLVRPPSFKKYKLPVIPLERALYGHPESGEAWNVVVEKGCIELGWKHIIDVGECSVYVIHIYDSDDKRWRAILMIVYTDDFALGGKKVLVIPLYLQLHRKFGFSEACVADPELRILLGLDFYRPLDEGTIARCFIHQRGYVETICEKFALQIGLPGASSLKPISTPVKTKPDGADVEKCKKPGRLAESASTHIGRLLWALRGSRSDIGVAVHRLSRRSNCWAEAEDSALGRVYRYLWTTRGLGLWFTVDRKTLHLLGIEFYTDSDHAGDREVTTRSSTGYACGVGAPGTWACLVASHHIQGATSRSTPEAELVACSDGTFQAAAPLCEFFHQVTGIVMPCRLHTDNEAARTVVGSGHSRRLGHVKKHHDVSMGAVNEFYSKKGREANRVPSGDNTSDLMTKPLDHVSHWHGVRLLGMGTQEQK